MRKYSMYELIRYKRFAEENPGLKPFESVQAYNKKYPELTSRQKLINISRLLDINNRYKHLTGEDIPEDERFENDDLP